MSMSKRSLAVVWGLCATALFAAEPEQPRFLEALDECEALWRAEKYDQLYEYVGELERKNPAYVPAKVLSAFREIPFGCQVETTADCFRRLTNQVVCVLCEVNPEFMSRVGEMANATDDMGALFTKHGDDKEARKKSEDPRVRTGGASSQFPEFYWLPWFSDIPFLVPDISLEGNQRVVSRVPNRARNLALKTSDLAEKALDIAVLFGVSDSLDKRISYCQKKELLDDYVVETAIVTGLKGLVEKFDDSLVRLNGYRALEMLRDNSMYAKQILKDYVERTDTTSDADDAKRMAVWALLQFAHDDPEIAEYLRQLPPKIDKSNRKTKEYLELAIRHLDEGCQRHFLPPDANHAQGEASVVLWRERLEERADEENLGEAKKARELRKE